MSDTITVDGKERDGLEVLTELHEFLQGTRLPSGMTVKHPPRLSPRIAMTVIWFLQEHLRLLPDHYEMCCRCGYMYDAESEGHYDDKTGNCWCDNCLPQAPHRIQKELGS